MKYIVSLFFLIQLSSIAANFPAKPVNYITDVANVINDADEALLNKKLHAFQDSTSSQIFVYITSSLEGADMVQLSHDIFDKWDIGQKGRNNGVLIAVFINDHKFRIHTGYGMEGTLPDVLTKRIQDEDMRPLFKQNNYYEGINKGVDKLIYYSKNEYKVEEGDPIVGFIICYVLTLVVIVLMFVTLHFGYKDKKRLKIALLTVTSVLGLIPVFGLFIALAIFLVFAIITLIRKISKGVSSGTWSSSGSSFYSGSSWGSSSDSSSSWSSSDSGSDFGGGGGGDSGGGGSSSDW